MVSKINSNMIINNNFCLYCKYTQTSPNPVVDNIFNNKISNSFNCENNTYSGLPNPLKTDYINMEMESKLIRENACYFYDYIKNNVSDEECFFYDYNKNNLLYEGTNIDIESKPEKNDPCYSYDIKNNLFNKNIIIKPNPVRYFHKDISNEDIEIESTLKRENGCYFYDNNLIGETKFENLENNFISISNQDKKIKLERKEDACFYNDIINVDSGNLSDDNLSSCSDNVMSNTLPVQKLCYFL